MGYPYKPAAGNVFMTVGMTDVGTADSRWVVPGFNGRIKRFSSAINGTLTTANSTASLAIGGVAVTGSTLTIPFTGSAAGNTAVATPSGNNTFGSTDAINIINNGESTGPQPVTFTLELEPN